jgi:hypothetical protein
VPGRIAIVRLHHLDVNATQAMLIMWEVTYCGTGTTGFWNVPSMIKLSVDLRTGAKQPGVENGRGLVDTSRCDSVGL